MTSVNSLWQNFQIAPLLDLSWLQLLGLVALLLIGIAVVLRLRGTFWRAMALALLLAALIAPQFTDRSREKLSDIVLVLADRSDSQKLGNRMAQTDQAIAALEKKYADEKNTELRIENVSGATDTRMFAALDRLLGGIPRERLAGVVMITDGQVHDIPTSLKLDAPLHALITGSEDEHDRRIQIRQAADYGIVGKDAEFLIEPIDPSLKPGTAVNLTLLHEDGTGTRMRLPVNIVSPITIPVSHAGQVISELRIDAAPDETNTANNRLILETTGVRDRLRVLLLSGEPHPGERAWRNLLRADPGVDLVHFTILRPPEKGDDTPINELALIPFPIRDLFEVRLHQFDLIIFDRYQMRGVLPSQYLDKVVDYVEGGGAALVVAGPEYVAPDGLAATSLGAMMPVRVSGRILEQPFVPKVNSTGRIHPVTAPIAGAPNTPPRWGHWYRQLEATKNDPRAMTLLTGINDLPLLTLSRVGDGRAAILTSDQMWLWQRGHDGGGPIAELLRRLSHWLMKEPALDENTINTARSADSENVVLTWRKIGAAPQSATATDPVSGQTFTARFQRQPDKKTDNPSPQTPRNNIWVAQLPISHRGLIRIQARDADGQQQTALHVDRDVLTEERRNTNSTTGFLRDVVAQNGGYIGRIEDGIPDFRQVARSGRWHGGNWAGLVETQSYRSVIGGITTLLPIPVITIVVMVLCLLGWRREAR
jgi:hypothetical protein